MHRHPTTYAQRAENRDDLAADDSHDRVDKNWTPEIQQQINDDAAAYREKRYALLDLGYSPDEVDVKLLEINTAAHK